MDLIKKINSRLFNSEKGKIGSVGLEAIVSIILLCFFSIINYLLFYNQSYCAAYDIKMYTSDMGIYMRKVLGLETPFAYPYPIFFKTMKVFHLFFPIYEAAAYTTTLFNVCSVIALGHFIREYIGKRKVLYTTLISIGVHMASMCILPWRLLSFRYIGVFTPNPWQNATFLAARPFAICSFFLFARICKSDSKADNIKDFVLFGGAMLLTVLTKPSFSLPMMIVCAIVIMIWIIKKQDKKINICKLVISVIPVMIVLLFQYSSVFIGDGTGGDGMRVGWFVAWSFVCESVPLAVILGALCPLIVLIGYHDKHNLWTLSWLFYIVNFLLFAFLYESGERFLHMNFSWGYMYGLFFLLIGAVIRLAESAHQKKRFTDWLGIVALSYHLLSGVYYFVYIYIGGDYRFF